MSGDESTTGGAENAHPAGVPTITGSNFEIVRREDGAGVVRRTDGRADDGEPLTWLSDVYGVPGTEGPVPVTLYERTGSRVLIRQVDPGEPTPDRIPLFDGDSFYLMLALSHASLHTNLDPGSSEGFLFGVRIVPVRTEGDTVFVRSLRKDEVDDGRRVHVPPGGTVTIEAGSFTAELEHIDSMSEATESGYAPLAPTLWTWLGLGPTDEVTARYLVAAARRLDTANTLFIDVGRRRESLAESGLAGPEIRRRLFDLVGTVELAVIAMGRAMDMVEDANDRLGRNVEVPPSISAAQQSVKEIRNAYEHIDDRAFGNVRERPHPDALTIFNWERLIRENVITYGRHELVVDQVPRLLLDMRRYFKDVAANV